MKHDDPAAAMRELRFATKIYPNDPSLWMERGEMAREMNEVQEAADSYSKARQLAGNEPRLMSDHTNELVVPSAVDDTRKSGSSEVPRLLAPAETQEKGGRPS
jgi:Flp pilus assembly protein TadD